MLFPLLSLNLQLLLFGPAGVGKTCTKAMMLSQTLPALRISTPLAERAVHVYRAKITSSKWVELSRDDQDKIIAQAACCCKLDNLPEYVKKETAQPDDVQTEQDNVEEESLSKPLKLSHDPSQDLISSNSELRQEAFLESTNIPTARPVLATTDEKLLVLMDGCSMDDPLDEIKRVQITDSGGQPQFHEVLPIFLRGTSVYVFFQKLSEKLDAYSTVEYFDENGESVCVPYQASQTNLQVFQHCLRVMHSQRSKSEEEKSARIIVIGTFEDEAHKCSETIQTKNKRLLELLLPVFEKEVVYYDLQPKKVIFPLNARIPGESGAKVIDRVRRLISTKCTADPVNVPLQWHALESLLEEMAETLKRDVLTKEECFLVAKQKLHFDEDSFDAALEYLDQLNVIFYFPEILPNVIFANTQVLLDKVTELVLAMHKLRHNLLDEPFTQIWQRFNDHALVSEDFLACFSKHYVPRHFTQNELVELFNKLLIFAKLNETEFFMPALLPMLTKEEVDKYRVDKLSTAAPVVIMFSGDVPCLGVFCASVVFLLSFKNCHPCQWELKMTDSSTPSCLYRNCVEFKIPDHPGTVIFIDAFKHFEIHVRLPENVPNIEKTICPFVRSAIFEAIRNADLALHYKISEPSLCLLCSCKVEECHAAIIKPGYYICSKDSDVCGPLCPNHLVWSKETVQPQSSPTSNRRLTESDIPQLMEKLAPHAAEWWEIGTALGFLPYELRLIRARPMLMYGAPASYLDEMLSKWVQWSPETMHAKYATVVDLRQALRSQLVGLGALAETV